MIEHPQFPFPATDDDADYGEKTEVAAWSILQALEDEWLERCRTGMGTSGLRAAAEALHDVQRILERETAHRKLMVNWICRDRPD